MAATAMKICTICNTDCADRPRVKDDAGRYTCKACVDKQSVAPQAKAPLPKAPVVVKAPPVARTLDEDGLDIRSAALMEARTEAMDLPEAKSCPKCQGFMPDDQRLCMRCGYDRKRGSKVMTRVEKVKEEKPDRSRHPIDVTWIVVGFGLLTVGCAISVFAAPVMVIPAVFLLLALGAGLYITMIACQFRDGETVYAICSLVGLFVGFTSIVSLYWLFAVNDRGWLKGLWACMVLSYVILFAAIINSADGFNGVFNGGAGGGGGGAFGP